MTIEDYCKTADVKAGTLAVEVDGQSRVVLPVPPLVQDVIEQRFERGCEPAIRFGGRRREAAGAGLARLQRRHRPQRAGEDDVARLQGIAAQTERAGEPRRAFRITRETSRRVNNWFL